MRVNIDVKREKLLVKVGGGQTGIDEFLQLYTSSELEKFEKRDPLAHVSERTLEEKIVGRSQTSPTRRQQSIVAKIANKWDKLKDQGSLKIFLFLSVFQKV